VDVVLEAARPPPRARRLVLALVTAFVVHAGALALALHSGASLETWAAELTVRIHQEIGRETVVETAPPPPPAPEPKPTPPPPRERVPPAERVAARPPPPAQAGQVIAREPGPSDPRDLTGDVFVTGTASAYAGGVTASSGTSTVAVESRTVDPASPPDQSRPLGIADPEYFLHCPWPPEADSADVDRVTVGMRVEVRADGTTERASVTSDPGLGFGPAAIACLVRAPRTVWEVALDRAGRAIGASSPFKLEFRR
jgi:protein TonB